jgi:plastin-1
VGKGGKGPNAFQMTENNNIVITSSKAIGCSVVNVGAQDLMNHPELYRLLDEGETLEEFLRLPPDQILLRWFNYHLKAANWPRRFVNLL